MLGQQLILYANIHTALFVCYACHMKRSFSELLLPLALLSGVMSVTPVAAERLHFDHRLYPALKAVFDNNRQDMIYFNNADPKYVVDRIAVTGTSADEWTEALNIIARSRSRTVNNADDWLNELRSKSEGTCASQVEVLAKDSISITFSKRSTNCGTDKLRFELGRIVTGKRSLFLLNAVNRDDMTDAMRGQWLALLNSARLEK